MVERKFKEGYSAPELKELEKELDKKAEEWYSLDEVTDSARKKRLWNDISPWQCADTIYLIRRKIKW